MLPFIFFFAALTALSHVCYVGAQNLTTTTTSNAPVPMDPSTPNCTAFNSTYCLNTPWSCKWCTTSTMMSSSSGNSQDIFGYCAGVNDACGSPPRSRYYNTCNSTLRNPCTALTTAASCVGVVSCGWCNRTMQCAYVGLSPVAVSLPTCSAADLVRVTPTCEIAGAASEQTCFNLPFICHWRDTPSACTPTYSGYPGESYCSQQLTKSSCVARQFATVVDTTSACGWCDNFLGMSLGKCLFYTSAGVPPQCASSADWTDNDTAPGSLAAVYVLVGPLLIVGLAGGAIFICVTTAVCVYWCCFWKPLKVRPVVQQQEYQEMNGSPDVR